MINNIKIEMCLGNIKDVEVLNDYPIDRIELNSALELGGLTPSINTLIKAKKISNKKIVCMCRNRGGDFNYSEEEYEVMFSDAKLMLEHGADGIVFGFLNPDNSINIEKTRQMVELIHSYHQEAIFHKAFDETGDLRKSASLLSGLGIKRILTAGGKNLDIVAGARIINELKEEFAGLEFLPGGGVRVDNIKEVATISRTLQIHMTAKKLDAGGYLRLDINQLKEMLDKLKELSLLGV